MTDIDDSVQTLNNNSINQTPTSSPETSDDFVFVSKNIPMDPIFGHQDKGKHIRLQANTQASPPRPSTLPISEPKPIPSVQGKANQQANVHVSFN